MILDLSLPDMDGFNVADRVLKVMPSLRILMLSSHCDDYTLFRVEKSGVHGFIDKNSNTVEILRDALKAIAAGRDLLLAGVPGGADGPPLRSALVHQGPL